MSVADRIFGCQGQGWVLSAVAHCAIHILVGAKSERMEPVR